MKLNIQKRLEAGRFVVQITGLELTEQERDQFKKFGFPSITVLRKTPSASPPGYALHPIKLPINHPQLVGWAASFILEDEARQYLQTVRAEVDAIQLEYAGKTDSFSGDETLGS